MTGKRLVEQVRFWWQNARPIALPQSVLPGVLALCMAAQTEGFSLGWGLVGVVGVVFGHLGINLWDDFFDYRVRQSGFRDTLARQGVRARIAKCHYLTSGQATTGQLLAACIVFSGVALLLGATIFLVRGWFVFWLAALTGVLGLSYSGWPLRFSYHGLGEILIGIIFGPLLMTGVYYAACGAFDPATLFISAPVGLLVMNIVYAHAIMDCAPDRACGKRTLAVALGSGRRMLGGLLALLVGAFGLVVGGVAAGRLSAWYLLTLPTLPMAGGLFYLMREFVLRPDRRFRPQLWMGPMGDWKRTEEVGLDWFRLRWQLARNLLVFFCLAIIAATLLSA